VAQNRVPNRCRSARMVLVLRLVFGSGVPGHLQLQRGQLSPQEERLGVDRGAGPPGREPGLRQVCSLHAPHPQAMSWVRVLDSTPRARCSAAHYLIMGQFDAAVVELELALAKQYVMFTASPFAVCEARRYGNTTLAHGLQRHWRAADAPGQGRLHGPRRRNPRPRNPAALLWCVRGKEWRPGPASGSRPRARRAL
jgi:hypothetical protein